MVFLMARPTKLQGSRFPYARKVVPEDVRHILRRTEFRAALRGESGAEVKRQHLALLAQWEAEIATARAQLAGKADALSQREVLAIAGQWYREQAAEMEENPGEPEGWRAWFDELTGRVPVDSDGERGAYDPNAEEIAEAETVLRARGIAAEAASVRSLAVALWENKLALAGLMERRAGGDYSPDQYERTLPAVRPMAPKEAAGALTGERLLDAWAAEANPASATRKKYGITFRQFSRILGFDDVRRISADDVVRFKEARLAEGRDPGTVADDVLNAGAVFRWAVKNRKLTDNPFAGMAPKVNRRGEPPRDPYDDADAKRILTAARIEAGWLRWGPWLLAFTGARVGELAELRRCDVRKEGGVPILDIRPTTTRPGKNATMQRMMPLHPAVIAEGFLAYVATLPADPMAPIFPAVTASKDGTRTTNAQAAHGRWVREVVGITDPRKVPAHSWRHRMEDELRKIRVVEEVFDAITGRHNPRNAGAGYGKGFRGMPDEVLKDLAKVPSPVPPRSVAAEG